MSRLSVIIPCYNSAVWIEQTLDSVFAQGADDLEVIVVDDGSTDDTAAILQNYDRGIRLLSQSNQGAGAARNLAVEMSTGDYIATLDSDDVWLPWTITVYREVIRKFNRPSAVGGRSLRFVEGKPRVSGSNALECIHYSNFYESARAGFWFLLPSALLIRKDVFEACGGFASEKINGEDTHLFMKFGMYPSFVAIKNPPLSGYRMHGKNAILDSERTHAGIRYLISQEKSGLYPGGPRMQRVRRGMLTRHTRAASVACIRDGYHAKGWELYAETFVWNVTLGRFKYVFGFILLAIRWMFAKASIEIRAKQFDQSVW